MNEESFNEEFCITLEYHLCQVFAAIHEQSVKGFWCDGILLPHESMFSKKKINDSRTLETTAWIGRDGQGQYTLVIHFGKYSLRRYAKSKPLNDCLRKPTDDQIKIDTIKKQIDLYLI